MAFARTTNGRSITVEVGGGAPLPVLHVIGHGRTIQSRVDESSGVGGGTPAGVNVASRHGYRWA